MLPGEQPVNWRCDPIPLILSAEEFAGLEAGLAQRARLIDAILADLYGPGTLVDEGRDPAGSGLRQSGVPAALPDRRHGPRAAAASACSTRPT